MNLPPKSLKKTLFSTLFQMPIKKKKKPRLGTKGIRLKCDQCDKMIDKKSMRRHVETIHEDIRHCLCLNFAVENTSHSITKA